MYLISIGVGKATIGFIFTINNPGPSTNTIIMASLMSDIILGGSSMLFTLKVRSSGHRFRYLCPGGGRLMVTAMG
jgi:hypothetical protein